MQCSPGPFEEKIMLNEYGTNYTRDVREARKLGWNKFSYSWSIGKKSGTHFLYCRSRVDALELINFWNRSSWRYILTSVCDGEYLG